jgi:hypothetical protein
MRVLFYGGCHAPALKRIFERSAIGKHDFTGLQNFELINSGTPFPYERLKTVDAVVFSPVRNKGEWNTSILKARCDELGLRTVSFPWLQFNGYFPGVGVAEPQHAPHKWTYQRLAEAAAAGQGVETLRATVEDPAAFDPLGYLDYAFDALAQHEDDLDFQIGPFIRRNFRQQRLFWTPDHPTLALYQYVQKQIAQRLGIWINSFARQEEAHRDSLPILPGVARALELGFEGGPYRVEGSNAAQSLDQFLALTVRLFGKGGG